ncbi:hypothetical protein EVC24_034 [Rhizobium phage RHph_I4]|nr:hypothetical protein EVC24_034 [Rhizobium phage RHph_I4]
MTFLLHAVTSTSVQSGTVTGERLEGKQAKDAIDRQRFGSIASSLRSPTEAPEMGRLSGAFSCQVLTKDRFFVRLMTV